MSAFLLGQSERPLFGYYHEPSRTARGQILLCQPWGPEYEFAHRTMRFLARRLADRGWHVLRFDYRGTGDSWGSTADADVHGWLEDTALAAAELRAITNLPELGFVGLRLGATIGSLAAGQIGPMDRSVLWDPILDGRGWVRETQSVHVAPATPEISIGRVEFGGQTVASSFLAQLDAITLLDEPAPARQNLVLWTQGRPTGSAWPSAGPGTVVEELDQPAPWLESVSLGAGQIPVDAVTRVVEWIDG